MDAKLVSAAISFLVAVLFCAGLHRWQFFKRLHSPHAAGHEHRFAAVALSAL